MATDPVVVVNPHPIICECPPGYGSHVHLKGDYCPVVHRWYAGPRYGQLDYGLAGVQWLDESGMVMQKVFHVEDGAVVVPQRLRDIPAGVFWCLCAHVGNARRRAVGHGLG